jgi:predicted ArsR family transcriptional regulator
VQRSSPPAVNGVLGEPRGRILTELCGHPQTAVELAERVGTSSNAVRIHLDGLRGAGLVDFVVARRGVGKPTHVFSLTSAGEHLLSSAYAPTLRALVDVLRQRLDGGLAPVLRETGASLASHYSHRTQASPAGDLDSAIEILESLGAPTRIDDAGSERVLSSECCPLATITRDTSEMCQLMESLLASASGLPMREQCARGEHPRCSFVVGRRARQAARGG